MDDDLFWPPLSGDGEDSEHRPAQPGGTSTGGALPGTSASDYRQPSTPVEDGHGGFATSAYPTEPLAHGEPEAAPEHRSGIVRTVALVGVTALVFGGAGVGVGAAIVHHDNSDSSSAIPAATSAAPSALTTSPGSDAAIAKAVLPSVVSINVTSTSESDTGSGIILNTNGYILTNNHVVTAAANGAGSVAVNFNDGSSTSAKIVGTDSVDDLAVIKVTKTGLVPAQLGDSSKIQVGDPVLAIGSPLGLTGTVTSGIVSALNRPVETQEETQPQQQQTDPFGLGGGGSGGSSSGSTASPTVIDAIQTDAAINPGNSGGALVDGAGQVIGINSAIASLGDSSLTGTQSGNIGVGFAIPINQAKTIANELITTGKALHPLLGVSLEDKTSGGTTQAVVHTVTAGGPAAKAGIKDNDVIIAIDGAQTEGTDAVIAAIRSHQPGQQVTVTVLRGGATKTVTATLTTESSTAG
jgi:putative serine protease PepD